MMDEYITKENAQLARPEWRCRNDQYDCGWNDCINEYLDMIDTIPAADVTPVRHGRWEKSYADHEAFGVRPYFRYCSECNEATVHQYNFCPNCGAKMDGDKK